MSPTASQMRTDYDGEVWREVRRKPAKSRREGSHALTNAPTLPNPAAAINHRPADRHHHRPDRRHLRCRPARQLPTSAPASRPSASSNIALDIHKRFAEVAIHEDGWVRRFGRVDV